MWTQSRSWFIVLVGSLALLLLPALSGPAEAFHFPWDQGHDTFTPDEGDDDTDPEDDQCNASGSPFELRTGNYFLTERDIVVPSLGVNVLASLDFIRTYNSRDMRSGQLGHGWSFVFEQRLVETTDGVTRFVVCHQGSGKRERYVQNVDGTYQSPSDLFSVLTRDANGAFTLFEQDGTVRTFSSAGLLTSIRDRNGNQFTFAHDDTGFLEKIQDQTGRTIQLRKGPNGKVAAVEDPVGGIFRYEHDAEGNLIRVTNPLGEIVQYEYDEEHNLRRVTNNEGDLVQQLTYDSEERVTSYLDATGAEWTVSYFPAERKTVKEDAEGNTWAHFFNEAGSTVKIIDPLGHETSTSYDSRSLPVSIRNQRGFVTKVEIDARGNLTMLENAVGAVAHATYDNQFNRLRTVTDFLGHTTTLEYDPNGNLAKVRDAVGNETLFEHDANGLLLSRTDSLGNRSTFAYDQHGNRVREVDPLGNKTNLEHDVVGNVTKMTEPTGAVWRFEYDALHRLVREIEPSGGVVEYVYDTKGNITSITDPLGGRHLFEYDAFGKVISIKDPRGAAQSIIYNTRELVERIVDQSGSTTAFAYDAVGRLIEKRLADDSLFYGYDPVGNLVSIADSDSHIVVGYDALNRVTSVETSLLFGAEPITHLAQYTYNAVGRRTSMSSSSGLSKAYAYDELNRLIQVEEGGELVAEYTYDALSRRREIRTGDGFTRQHTYDANGQISRLTLLGAGGQTVRELAFEYDGNSNRTVLTANGTSALAEYDSLNQLESFGQNGETYSYDLAGNRVSSHLSSTYRYDPGNRLVEDDQFLYGYDRNGNVTSRTNKSTGAVDLFVYNSLNQLIRIESEGMIAEYRYDGLGRRYAKSVNGELTLFVYDNEDIVAILDATGVATARIVHGPNIDEPIRFTLGQDQDVFFHPDGLGSIVLGTSSDGDIERELFYDSFGQILPGSDGGLVYAFTGREYDPESGLYFFRNRYYDSRLGRFLQEDPAGFLAGYNFYVYVRNNPLNFVDPDGLQAFAGALPVAGGFAAADGPLPVGDAIAVGILVGAGLYELWDILNPPEAVPVPIPREVPRQRRGRWYCKASCNVQAIGKACCPDRVFGDAYGPSEGAACRAAKRVATQSAPRGCYARHCQCRCQKR